MTKALRTATAITALVAAGLVPATPSRAQEASEWKKPIPIGFVLDYSLWSDFICRKAINLSEYPGEGREGLNQQIWAAASLATKDVLGVDLGKFEIGYWADWYAGQEGITPNHDGDLNEWDLIASWTYGIPKTPLTVSLAYDYWVLPPYDEGGASHDSYSGNEVWTTLALDDSCIFGTRVFSPCVLWVKDIDDIRESWINVGVAHTFVLSALGCKDTPVLKHVSITPKVVLGIDDGYLDTVAGLDQETHVAAVNYSLTVGYDLGAALGLRPKYGSVGLRGFIHYKDQIHDYDTAGFYPVLRDEVYGGVGITYAW